MGQLDGRATVTRVELHEAFVAETFEHLLRVLRFQPCLFISAITSWPGRFFRGDSRLRARLSSTRRATRSDLAALETAMIETLQNPARAFRDLLGGDLRSLRFLPLLV